MPYVRQPFPLRSILKTYWLSLLMTTIMMMTIKSGSSLLLRPLGSLPRRRVLVLGWGFRSHSSQYRRTEPSQGPSSCIPPYSTTRLSAARGSSSSSWKGRPQGPEDPKRNFNNSPSPTPKFLTSKDLDQTKREYRPVMGDDEDDVDRMASYYNPEEDDFDINLQREDAYVMKDIPQKAVSTTKKNKSMDVRPTFAKDTVVPSPTKNKGWEEQDEEIVEPLSPLSFISLIADPNPVDDNVKKYPYNNTKRLDDEASSTNTISSSKESSIRSFQKSMEYDNFTKEQPSRNPPTNPSGSMSSSWVVSSTITNASSDDLTREVNRSSISVEEFRAKYSSYRPSPDASSVPDRKNDSQLQPPGSGRPSVMESSRQQDILYQLEMDLKRLEGEIIAANNGVSFNLASPKQVSQVLFGTSDQSVSKSVLEGMAGWNAIAQLILEHRQLKNRYNKLKKQEDWVQQKAEGRQVSTSYSPLKDEPLILVDTSSFIFRAYYSMPPMHRSDGLPNSAVLGFCNMLNRMVMTQLLNGKQPRLVLCCDAPSPTDGGPKTIRHELYDQYKATRREIPMDLIPQFPLFRIAAQAYGMLWVEAPGYEADDVIASLSHMALEEGLSVHIYSGDKDLMQLVTNSSSTHGQIKMIDPMTMTHWEHDDVVEKWGVAAHQLGDVLALAGDNADNVPGVPGIGPKIAAQLLQEFGSLDNLLLNLDKVRQTKRRQTLETYRDQAILSQQLVSLVRNLNWENMTIDSLTEDQISLPPPERVGDLRMAPIDADRILQFYQAMEFRTIKERLIERLQRQSKIQYKYQSSTPSKKNSRNQRYTGRNNNRGQRPDPEDFDNVPF